MTDYAPTTWVNGGTPAINATNLNHLEDGVEAGHNELASAAAYLPAGIVIPFAGAAAPTGWLLCDGLAVSRTTYADLFDAIGETWGDGDNVTTFNVPDLRDRTPAGESSTHVRGTLGGMAAHVHETESGGTHGHTGDPGGSTGSVQVRSGAGLQTTVTEGHDHGTTSLGGGSHTHTTDADDPPYQATPYIIKAFSL